MSKLLRLGCLNASLWISLIMAFSLISSCPICSVKIEGHDQMRYLYSIELACSIATNTITCCVVIHNDK
jgi:hypothetical protein